MAVIKAQADPVFVDVVRKLAGDDGGDVALDLVDAVSTTLLNNTKAAYDLASSAVSAFSIKTVSSATYDVLDTDYTILVDGSSNTVDINMPTAVGREGVIFVIKAIDITNDVTLNAQAGEEIDGSADFTFASQYDSITVQSDGSNWWVI